MSADYVIVTELWVRVGGIIALIRDGKLIDSWREKNAPVWLTPEARWVEATILQPRELA